MANAAIPYENKLLDVVRSWLSLEKYGLLVAFVLMMLGFNLTFLPQHLLGIDGMPRRIHTYPSDMGFDLWNMLSTIGAFMIALSIIVFAVNALRSVRSGEVAGPDPWDGGTLEWTIPSPPPVYNFAVIPVVNSQYPAWDTKRGSGHTGAETPPSEPDPDANHPNIHMPNPSYWPILLAAGLVLAACGLIFHQVFILLGAMIFGISLLGWIEEPAA